MSEPIPPEQRAPREPIVNLPAVVTVLIVAFFAIHAWREFLLDSAQDDGVLRLFSFVPGRLTLQFAPDSVAEALTQLMRDPGRLWAARYLLGDHSAQPWSVLTYAFLHGDFVHVTVNSLWLAVFGAPVARRFGVVRFCALFVVTAVAGVALHYVLHSVDFVPVVGASAAVSGIMAAALRFVFQPGGPLGPAVPGWRLPPEFSARLPALPLRDVVRERRVLQFCLIWFAINLIFGLFSVQLGATSSQVAWEAHVGGFVAGFLLFHLFDPPPPPPEAFAQFKGPVWRY